MQRVVRGSVGNAVRTIRKEFEDKVGVPAEFLMAGNIDVLKYTGDRANHFGSGWIRSKGEFGQERDTSTGARARCGKPVSLFSAANALRAYSWGVFWRHEDGDWRGASQAWTGGFRFHRQCRSFRMSSFRRQNYDEDYHASETGSRGLADAAAGQEVVQSEEENEQIDVAALLGVHNVGKDFFSPGAEMDPNERISRAQVRARTKGMASGLLECRLSPLLTNSFTLPPIPRILPPRTRS